MRDLPEEACEISDIRSDIIVVVLIIILIRSSSSCLSWASSLSVGTWCPTHLEQCPLTTLVAVDAH